jgi:hypothetical protein
LGVRHCAGDIFGDASWSSVIVAFSADTLVEGVIF